MTSDASHTTVPTGSRGTRAESATAAVLAARASGQRTRKRASPTGVSRTTSTSVTRAPGGPCRHQATIRSTPARSPSNHASTRPSGRLRTQPPTPPPPPSAGTCPGRTPPGPAVDHHPAGDGRAGHRPRQASVPSQPGSSWRDELRRSARPRRSRRWPRPCAAGPSSARRKPRLRLVPPADVARAPPPGLAQAVEAPVVAHPEGGVGLHVVPAQLAQAGPGVEEAGPPGDDRGHRRPAVVLRRLEGGGQGGQGLGGLGGQDRLGQARGEGDVSHGRHPGGAQAPDGGGSRQGVDGVDGSPRGTPARVRNASRRSMVGVQVARSARKCSRSPSS